jgi:hypothetical protein
VRLADSVNVSEAEVHLAGFQRVQGTHAMYFLLHDSEEAGFHLLARPERPRDVPHGSFCKAQGQSQIFTELAPQSHSVIIHLHLQGKFTGLVFESRKALRRGDGGTEDIELKEDTFGNGWHPAGTERMMTTFTGHLVDLESSVNLASPQRFRRV